MLDPQNSDLGCSRFHLQIPQVRDGNGESLSSYPDETVDIPWIALVLRGGCSVDDKIENAQSIGAIGIVV